MGKQVDINIPKIRIHGFEGEWERKLIGSILSEVKRPIKLEDDQSYELITVRRRNEGIVSRGFLLGRNILVKNYSQLQIGDFVISKRQVVHGASGIVPAKLNKAIVSNEYLVAVENSDISTEFLATLSSLPKMKRKFFLSSYGVDIEKLFFDVEDWKGRFIKIPKLGEQLKISAYLKGLDQLIHLHQLKHKNLITLKKTMLQKMFPQSGNTIPEIRFKGFSGEWVVQKLGEVGRAEQGIGFPEFEQGGNVGLPFFKVSDMSRIGNQLEMFTANNYVSVAQLKRKKWTPINDIPAVIFAKVGAAIMLNRKRMVRAPFLIDNNMMAYIFDSTWDANFGITLFDTINLPIYVQVGALPSYNGSDIERIVIQRPNDQEEQQKIGNYFCTLDDLISKHATQLQKLKQIKKACMEKMFV